MSKSCRRTASGELDVFEAALYFSGEVNEASLIGIQRTRRVAERRSVDAPAGREAMEVIFKSKDVGERQPLPCPPGGKLANFIRSFFHLVIPKKKNSEYVEKQRKSRERGHKSTPLSLQRERRQNGRSAKSNKCCEEDGGGSDSSSDLFDLRSCATGV